jgi:hypothetical protein
MKTIIILIAVASLHLSTSAQDYKGYNAFLKSNVTSAGVVDYKAINSNKSQLASIFDSFKTNEPSKSDSKDEQLAYWINLYNIATISLVIDNYPVKSIKDIAGGKPWDKDFIKVGSKLYSLNDIENKIIRPIFKDARIHFALNCGAKSCPPLLNTAFVGSSLNSQLDKQTKAFINDKSSNSFSSSNYRISRIFDWYGEDFGDLPNFINKYSSTKVGKGATKSFTEYNWTLNGK